MAAAWVSALTDKFGFPSAIARDAECGAGRTVVQCGPWYEQAQTVLRLKPKPSNSVLHTLAARIASASHGLGKIKIWGGMMFLFVWIRRLYDWVLALSEHPRGVYWLALISFAESSIFPIPPDILLLPLCLAKRERAYRMALVCTASSIAGAAMGYAIGYFAFDKIGNPILTAYGAMEKYDLFKGWYDSYGSVMVFVAGFTPIPYKVVTITAGAFKFPLLSFFLFSIISRGLRFTLVAWVVRRFGENALRVIDTHFNKLTIAGGVLFVGGFLAVKLFLSH